MAFEGLDFFLKQVLIIIQFWLAYNYVDQAGLKPVELCLCLPPKCRDYRMDDSATWNFPLVKMYPLPWVTKATAWFSGTRGAAAMIKELIHPLQSLM